MTVLEAVWVAGDFDFTEVAAAALDPELRACAAVVLAFAPAAVVGREAGVLEAAALEPEPPAVLEVCARRARNHTATNSANVTSTIWKGRESWVICKPCFGRSGARVEPGSARWTSPGSARCASPACEAGSRGQAHATAPSAAQPLRGRTQRVRRPRRTACTTASAASVCWPPSDMSLSAVSPPSPRIAT